jgi:hypothetical protein
MSLEYPTPEMKTAPGHPWGRWTPRAIRLLSAAKAIAGPSAQIEAEDLLLAFEAVALATGENPASRALAVVGIRPSVALGRCAPETCPPNRRVSLPEFGPSLSSVFPNGVIEEAAAMGDDYVGIEHLLLFVAKVGVHGVELPYARIHEAILGAKS